jgi:hypothetical protein
MVKRKNTLQIVGQYPSELRYSFGFFNPVHIDAITA